MVLVQNINNSISETETETATHLSCSSSYDADITETPRFSEDFDSTCSTPYVSAPSSPGRGPTSGYFFSAPASPMHFVLSSAPSAASHISYDSSLITAQSDGSSFEFEFEFSPRFSCTGSLPDGSMSSADELFLNGQIRPMKLSSHLQKPQILAPLFDLDVEDDNGLNNPEASRGRDLKLRSRSLHRHARSLSPLRNPEFQCEEEEDCSREERTEVRQRILGGLKETVTSNETTPSSSASSSRSSSTGRNSKKWIFLKELLYRSKSEGRGNGKEKFWNSISFSPSKEKKIQVQDHENLPPLKQKQKENKKGVGKKVSSGKPANGVAKRRVPPSPHELLYSKNRAQAEEMKKRTYLPYRQGFFGCLSFSSKGCGALNGLARSLNPVSSR